MANLAGFSNWTLGSGDNVRAVGNVRLPQSDEGVHAEGRRVPASIDAGVGGHREDLHAHRHLQVPARCAQKVRQRAIFLKNIKL